MKAARKIIAVYESGKSFRKTLTCTYDDGKHGELFTYYPKQRTLFQFEEFIGLTRSEAMQLGKIRLHSGRYPWED